MSAELYGVIFALIIVIYFQWLMYNSERTKRIKADSGRISANVTKGLAVESLIPFSKDFDYDWKDARFIGSPVDFLVFASDKVVFFEVKTGKSRLNERQQNLKKLIENKQVYWEEVRI